MNTEENHKDNDETIKRNNVKSEQLVTQLQSNNGVTFKTSESTTHANSSIATTPDTDQRRASKSAAKKSKSIIPARKLCLDTSPNGSLVKKDSSKEL